VIAGVEPGFAQPVIGPRPQATGRPISDSVSLVRADRRRARDVTGSNRLHEAKTQLSRLIARAEAGEEIVVRRGAKPVAKIVAYEAPSSPRTPGHLNGRIALADDFDEIPPEFAEYTG
jgi:antitoxin (DNA-binding transcriptional repressor) of toxin-antitoxin stability system